MPCASSAIAAAAAATARANPARPYGHGQLFFAGAATVNHVNGAHACIMRAAPNTGLRCRWKLETRKWCAQSCCWPYLAQPCASRPTAAAAAAVTGATDTALIVVVVRACVHCGTEQRIRRFVGRLCRRLVVLFQ